MLRRRQVVAALAALFNPPALAGGWLRSSRAGKYNTGVRYGTCPPRRCASTLPQEREGGTAAACSGKALIVAALAAGFIACAAPAAHAQYVPAVPGQSCTNNGAYANNNGILLCSGGVWVASPIYIGTQSASCSSTYTAMERWNSSTSKMEYCNGSAWTPFSSGSGSSCVGSAGTDTSLATGLTLYYGFEEDGDQVAHDYSGNGNYGFWEGTLGSQWTSGKINYGGNFNGTDNFMISATQIAEPTTSTISVWFKTSVASGGKIIGFQNSQNAIPSSDDDHIYVGTDGKLYYGVYPGAVVTVNSSGTVTDGNWHHAVAVENAGVISLYLDGVLQGTATGAPQGYNGYWTLGAGIGGWPQAPYGTFFPGQIDEVGIWNVALTSAQIASLYNAGAGNAFGATVCPLSITTSSGFVH